MFHLFDSRIKSFNVCTFISTYSSILLSETLKYCDINLKLLPKTAKV